MKCTMPCFCLRAVRPAWHSAGPASCDRGRCLQANFLTKYASVVYLVHRRNSFRASKIMQARVQDNPKIQVRACLGGACCSVAHMPRVVRNTAALCWVAAQRELLLPLQDILS